GQGGGAPLGSERKGRSPRSGRLETSKPAFAWAQWSMQKPWAQNWRAPGQSSSSAQGQPPKLGNLPVSASRMQAVQSRSPSRRATKSSRSPQAETQARPSHFWPGAQCSSRLQATQTQPWFSQVPRSPQSRFSLQATQRCSKQALPILQSAAVVQSVRMHLPSLQPSPCGHSASVAQVGWRQAPSRQKGARFVQSRSAVQGIGGAAGASSARARGEGASRVAASAAPSASAERRVMGGLQVGGRDADEPAASLGPGF